MASNKRDSKRLLLLFTEISDTGGIEVFGRDFLQEVVKQSKDIRVDVVLLRNYRLPSEFSCLPDSVSVVCCNAGNRLVTIARFVLCVWYKLLFCRPDIVIGNHIDTLKPYVLLAPLLRVPFSVIVYGMDIWTLSWLARRILQKARVIASISRHTTSQVLKQVDCGDAVMRLPPMVDMDRFSPGAPNKDLRNKYGFRDDDRVVLCVCRFSQSEQYKGYDQLIKAWPSILRSIPNAKLLFVGTGDDLERVRQLAAEESCHSIVFAGYVSTTDLVDHYNLCDVFAMPSRGEGFGIVFLEALACGKPVVAGNQDGSTDAVLDGEVGLQVNPDSVREIEQAIVIILSGQIREELLDGAWLRDRTAQEYGRGAFARRVGELLVRSGIIDGGSHSDSETTTK